MRGLCLSRSEKPPRDDSGRKRELNILLLIQGARLQKLEKVSRFESFNISVPLNDVHFSTPYWLMTFRFPRRIFKRTLYLSYSKIILIFSLSMKNIPPPHKTNRIMADLESLCLSDIQVRRKRLLSIKHTLTSYFIGNQGNHRIDNIDS
jgi:hypothetical protein